MSEGDLCQGWERPFSSSYAVRQSGCVSTACNRVWWGSGFRGRDTPGRRDDERDENVDEEVLARAGIFQGVAPDAVAALTRQLGSVAFPCGHTVFAEGDASDRLYIILEGRVKLARRTSDGRENLLAVMGPADMFGELAVFDPGPRTSTVTTLTDVRAASIDRAASRSWIREHPEIAEQLLRVLVRRLRRTNDSLTSLIFTDVPSRVANQLLQLAERFGVQEGAVLWVDTELTQEELAQLVGSVRETVNKALGDFVHRGWVRLQGNAVLIVDPKRLARRAGIHFEQAARDRHAAGRGDEYR